MSLGLKWQPSSPTLLASKVHVCATLQPGASLEAELANCGSHATSDDCDA
jgi:hypothetical protein